MEIFCFFIGIVYLYTCNQGVLLSLIALFIITPRSSLLFGFILGLLVACAHNWLTSPTGFPKQAVRPVAIVAGTIASIPISARGKTQFLLAVTHVDNHQARGLIQLSWYQNAPILHAGEHWQLQVKLKKPRNFINPGSFDYVNSLNSRHIEWTGYVRSGPNKLLPTPRSLGLLLLRERFSKAINRLSPDARTTGVIEALTLNMTHHISQEDWGLFRRTGTTHLFGISGEHVALISGLITYLLRTFWARRVSRCLRLPALSFASIGGFLIALSYAFLAGFAPPVQRAIIGCFCFTLYCMGKTKLSAWQIWRYALFGVLCLEPHAVFMQGFYFSFLAVSCLLLTQQRWQYKGYRAKCALQLSCLIGLMPLTLYWFSYGSLNGLLANSFAIPLVGFFIVPLALITMLISFWSGAWLLMKPLTWLIALLFKGLVWTEALAAINLNFSISNLTLVIAWLGTLLIWVVLPVKPFRYLALLWLVLPFFPARLSLNPGEFKIDVLDVGQGLAVHIQTQNHTLLYDTGDQFYQGSDMGKMVILPFYNKMNIKSIDTIVISHPDKDHRGGLNTIEAAMPVSQLLINDRRYYNHGLNCHHYPEWIWDEVVFRFFPIKLKFNDKNNNSCILQVSNVAGSVLFTGDIEKAGEEYLLKNYSAQLASSVLIVPHHASKTSSSLRFLLDVAPRFAIASIGFDNRFHFPHAPTVEKLQKLDIDFYRTDECGMVEVFFPNNGIIDKPKCFNK